MSARPSLRTNEIGNHYDEWEVIEYVGSKRGKSLWRVRCDRCQYEAPILGRALRNGVRPRHKCGKPICRKCGKSEPEISFEGKGRFGNICVGCRKDYMVEWRGKNVDYVAAYMAEHAAKNKEARNKYHLAERERVQQCPYRFLKFILGDKARSHCYHMTLKNPDGRAKRTQTRPELHHFSLTAEFLHKLWDTQHGKCAITGMPMAHRFNDLKSVSIDRIESDKGYVESNVQLVCRWVNLAKGRFSDEEIRRVLDEFRRS